MWDMVVVREVGLFGRGEVVVVGVVVVFERRV